jgi:V8-like Glu-specific endopeptidase
VSAGGLAREPEITASGARLRQRPSDIGAFTIEDDAPIEDVGLASEAAVEDLIDAADYAVIGPVDGRRRVRDATRLPYRAVCHLWRDFGDGGSGCTGALIGPRHVLTAGHCVLSQGHGGPPRAIDVLIGRDGASVVARVRSTRFYAPQAFARGHDRSYDYGLIELPRPIGTRADWLPPVALGEQSLRRLMGGRYLTIAGYPSDKPRGTMWVHQERLNGFDRLRLRHSVDTCPGHSGSPIIAPVGGRFVTMGVHVAGVTDPETGRSFGCSPGVRLAPASGVNTGIRLTSDLLASFRDPGRPTGDPNRLLVPLNGMR